MSDEPGSVRCIVGKVEVNLSILVYKIYLKILKYVLTKLCRIEQKSSFFATSFLIKVPVDFSKTYLLDNVLQSRLF
jgi:hypothetical protein